MTWGNHSVFFYIYFRVGEDWGGVGVFTVMLSRVRCLSKLQEVAAGFSS